MSRVVYLHGFASSPASKKARFFGERFAALGVDVDVPALDGGDFFSLTLTSQLRIIEQTVRGERVTLMGSSLGGYLAALYAARHANVDRIILMAPAFGFFRRWSAELGADTIRNWRDSGRRTVTHYGLGGETPLGWGLMEDSEQYEEEPDVRQPTLIFHGVNDVVVPVEASRHFAATRGNVTLREYNSDHELIDVVDAMWTETRKFLAI